MSENLLSPKYFQSPYISVDIKINKWTKNEEILARTAESLAEPGNVNKKLVSAKIAGIRYVWPFENHLLPFLQSLQPLKILRNCS